MDIRKIMDSIQTHPLVVALVVFAVFFIAYNVMKKNNASAGLPGGAGAGTALAPGQGGNYAPNEVYASQLYQYPTYTAPVVNQNAPPPVTTPTPVTNPPPASSNVYHGILGVVGSIHPLNIGPWIAGRHVNVAGGSYILQPGPKGRLHGLDKATGQQVTLWDGNDYAGGARTAATVGAY